MPNLFQFATSELSQDAFICWLLSHADNSCRSNEPLYKTGRNFLKSLLQVSGIDLPSEITELEVRQQLRNIDIVVVLNGGTHVLVIEDKVFTSNHSEQLSTYKDAASEEFQKAKIGFIYFKTGNQSNLTDVESKGYKVFHRQDFIEVLDDGVTNGVESDIFLDYRSYLKGIDDSIQAYKTKPINNWDEWNCWTGFFTDLQLNHLGDAEWDYVHNPSGGFMGLWWYWKGDKYLQLERDKLCFKIGVQEADLQSESRNRWHDELMVQSKSSSLRLEKPTRFGKGAYMTVALLNGGADYRVANEDGTLNMEATVAVLRSAEGLLDSAVENSE